MPINIINSNEKYKADAIIRPFCTDSEVLRLFAPKIKTTTLTEPLYKYEIRANYPIPSLKKGNRETKESFKKSYLKCLKAARKKGCEKVVVDLQLHNNANEIQKLVYDEIINSSEVFLSKNEIDILLIIGNGDFTLSERDLFSDISKFLEEHLSVQADVSTVNCKKFRSDNLCDAAKPYHSDRDDGDCFCRFPPEKKYIVDCFCAREFEKIQEKNCEDEYVYFCTDYTDADEDCFSFGDIADWDTEEQKYQDSDVDLPDYLNLNRHLHTKEINTIAKVIINKYNSNECFFNKLMRLIDSKGMDYRACYQKANVSRQTWSQIKNDPSHRPQKRTIISFAFALELTLDETQELLGSVGYALSYNILFDFIVIFFLKKGIYNINTLNAVLYDLKQDTLYC